jgi:hypothetical protein
MSNPTVIDLSKTGGQDYWSFSDNQDVIFIGDTSHTRTDKIQTQGGHNIMVLGGDYQVNTAPTGSLAFYGATGTVFVDGVHIDNSKSSGTDGIDISGGQNTSLVVQNTSIENVNGAFSGGQAASGNGHADGIQIQGDLGGQVDLHNVHVSTNYQGLFMSPQYSIAPSKVTLDNVDLHYTSDASNDGRTTSYLLWSNDDPSQQQHVPWSFNNVYVQPRDGQQAIESAVWPKAGMGAEQNGDQITWPNMPYTGAVTVGDHASFVDATKTGANFHDANALVAAAEGTGSVSTVGASTPATGTTSGSTTGGTTGGTTADSGTGSTPATDTSGSTTADHGTSDTGTGSTPATGTSGSTTADSGTSDTGTSSTPATGATAGSTTADHGTSDTGTGSTPATGSTAGSTTADHGTSDTGTGSTSATGTTSGSTTADNSTSGTGTTASHAPTVAELLHEMTLDYQAIFSSSTGAQMSKAINEYFVVEHKFAALLEHGASAMAHGVETAVDHQSHVLDHWQHH